MGDPWVIEGLGRIASPALLLQPCVVEQNVERMIDLCGGARRLRPHVKTHKMDEVVRMQISAGIDKFKASTIAEVEMCLTAGARDVLLAYSPVGPSPDRLIRLAEAYPDARLSFLADDEAALLAISQRLVKTKVPLGVFVDFDCGMGRTGTSSVEAVVGITKLICSSAGLSFEGVHAYDGHVREPNPAARREMWSQAMTTVDGALAELAAAGHPVPAVVGGGSPTFGFHARLREWQCSPGTSLFWDHGYETAYPELPFSHAAAVLTRVISKPGTHRLCLDLGHKAIASEGPPDRRIHLRGLEHAHVVGHSEEHMVLECENAEKYQVGDPLLGIPFHICPTVALYSEATLVRDAKVTRETWEVTARNRSLTI